MRVVAIVVNWNGGADTLGCVESLLAQVPPLYAVIVVDHASTDGSCERLRREFAAVEVLETGANLGYSGGNNQGARLATGRFLCLLNSDTEVAAGALDQLVDWLVEHPEYGMAAPRLVNPDGSVQRACMAFPGPFTALCYDTWLGRFPPGKWVDDRYYMRGFDHLHSRDVDQPPGACCVIDRQEYLDGGGLDEELWLFFNDVDICRRLWKRGRKIRYVAEAEVMHHCGASTKGFQDFVVIWHRNRLSYYRKHYGPWIRPWMQVAVRMRAAEEWWRAGRRNADPDARRAERAFLKQAVQQIFAPGGSGR